MTRECETLVASLEQQLHTLRMLAVCTSQQFWGQGSLSACSEGVYTTKYLKLLMTLKTTCAPQ